MSIPRGNKWVGWLVAGGFGVVCLQVATYPQDAWSELGPALWFVSIFVLMYWLSWWTYQREWWLSLIWTPASLAIATGLYFIMTDPEWIRLAALAVIHPALLLGAAVFQFVMRAIYLRWHAPRAKGKQLPSRES